MNEKPVRPPSADARDEPATPPPARPRRRRSGAATSPPTPTPATDATPTNDESTNALPPQHEKRAGASKRRAQRAGGAKVPSRRAVIVPGGLDLSVEKQRQMLADFIKLTAWWTGRPPTPKLPPRLERALRELLRGASEKQVAKMLNVSTHTMHDYAKALHKRLGVNTRSELLNRFLPRG